MSSTELGAKETAILALIEQEVKEARREEIGEALGWFMGIPDTYETRRLHGMLSVRLAELSGGNLIVDDIATGSDKSGITFTKETGDGR